MHEVLLACTTWEVERMREGVVGTQVAGFEVEEERGSGGFGTVYKARRGGGLFALKLIRLQGAGGEWGEREVDILRKLRHPNVVGFRGCGYWPDAAPRFLFIVMEYVEGLALDAWARAHNPSARELVRKLLPLVEALRAVHAAGVVHRDLKESNILVRQEDGQPVLVDFGSGAYEGARRITEGVLPPGTAEYRGPEALRFALADTAESDSGSYQPGPEADLWALGVILYRLLTGSLPFGHRHHQGMVRAILHEAPVPPHERNPRVPRALGELCLRLLEKSRPARLAEAPALGAALDAALAEADASWDVPLSVQVWDTPSEVPEARPRVEVPPAPVPRPVRTPRSAEAPRRAWRLAAGGLLTAVLLAAGAYALGAKATREVRTELQPIGSSLPLTIYQGGNGQEVAPPWKPLESSEGAALSRTVSPAPVAAATLQKEDTRVKTPPKKRLGTLAAACTTAAALSQGACALHPILRPPPPPEECPQGAVATMEKLGVELGDYAIAYPPGTNFENITVREGNVTLKMLSRWPKLMGKPLLYGKFIFGGQRVHGRFTQMLHPSGYFIPVCFEVWDYEGGRGSDEEGKRGLGTAVIFGKMEVRAVDRFQ
jgi:serine/threonine-protein kinase